MKHANWGLVILLLAPARVAMARQQSTQQSDPIAAAARRAREQKQQQAKPARVWDNDTIPKSPGALSVIGQAAPDSASPENAPAASGAGKDASPTTPKQKSDSATEVAALKEQLQTLQNDLDILQRKYILDQQTYNAKPGYASDKAGAASLQDEQDQIDAKQQEMIAAQQKIVELQEKLSGGTPGASSETKNDSQ